MVKFHENGICDDGDDVKKVFFPRLKVYSFLVQNTIAVEDFGGFQRLQLKPILSRTLKFITYNNRQLADLTA